MPAPSSVCPWINQFNVTAPSPLVLPLAGCVPQAEAERARRIAEMDEGDQWAEEERARRIALAVDHAEAERGRRMSDTSLKK